MVCFRDSSPTHASGDGAAPALESTSNFRHGSVVASRSQCDSCRNFVGSSLSAYLDKRNRFSEELGAGAHPVYWFANLENSAVDPRRDRRGTRWNLFVTTRANLKYIEVKIITYGQTPFQPSEHQCPGSIGSGPVTTRTGFLRGRDQEIHVSCRVGNRSIREDRNPGVGKCSRIGFIVYGKESINLICPQD